MHQNIIGLQIFIEMHHVYLLLVHKDNFMMLVYFEASFPIKRVSFVYKSEI